MMGAVSDQQHLRGAGLAARPPAGNQPPPALRLPLAALAALAISFSATAAPDYAIVVSAATRADAGWADVVAALQKKHAGATVVTYTNRVQEALAALQAQFPRYTCFVATPAEATRAFVAAVHRLTRAYDPDPYPDTFWGILTGYDARNALRIASYAEPLVIRRVLSGTPVTLQRCDEGVWFSELDAGRVVRKAHGSHQLLPETGPVDSTAALVTGLNEYNADLLVTSGHATEHDWQVGYRYRNGQFRCQDGQLFGLDTKGNKLPVSSQHARVYLPVGNCLMGHIDGPDCMALAFMNSAGVMQMAGYTVPSWFGYAGWGMLDYFLEQPGRFTLNEAFIANQHALIHRLLHVEKRSPDAKGLAYDRDVLAFYGDPAWSARMAEAASNWEQVLRREGDTYTFEILPHCGEKTFAPVDTNGSQRGGRPIIQFLPHRLKDIKMVKGTELNPVIAHDFILVPLPEHYEAGHRYQVVFQAVEVGAK